MKTIELNGNNQRILEERCKANIHDCNAKIKKNNATYQNWENADERIKNSYTKEEYKAQCIDYWYTVRHSWIMKLKTVRQGFIYE